MTDNIYKNIYRIYVPLPGNPLKYLNSYVIRSVDGGKNLLIDTGFNRPECLSALLDGLKELGLRPEDTDVFISHVHSDHAGNAAALQELGSHIIMTRTDYVELQNIDWPARGRWYMSEGMPVDVWNGVFINNPAIRYAPAHFDAECVDDGDMLCYGGFSLRCIKTPGHTLGHMCLYCADEKLLFSGDHVLFDITPNICTMGPDTNMLGDYLESLEKLRSLDISLTLPSHRSTPSRSIYERIDALMRHHKARLSETERIVLSGHGLDAYSVAGRMTWKIRSDNWETFPISQKWFAMGEAIAHLQYLCAEGRIVREALPDGRTVYRGA